MAQLSSTSTRSQGFRVSRIFVWLIGIASFGILGYLLVQITYQIVVPPPAHRLLFVQDIPLPSGLGATSPGTKNPLGPGVQQDFDALTSRRMTHPPTGCSLPIPDRTPT